MDEKRQLFGWFSSEPKEKTYSIVEIEDLLRRVKQFNAGVIDEYLDAHVDKVFESWKNELGGI